MTARSLQAVHRDQLARMTSDEKLKALIELDRMIVFAGRDKRLARLRALEFARAALESIDTHGRGGTRAADVLWNEEA